MTKNNSSTVPKNNGKGSTKRVSPEEHEARRRAKKASQNANARANAVNKNKDGESFLDGLHSDRRDRAEKVRAERDVYFRSQSERQLKFRINQAVMASEMKAFTKLRKGTVAYKMASLVILEFPTVQPERGTKRTEAAVMQAYLQLSGSEIAQSRSVDYGARQAKRALYMAYERLTYEHQL